MNKERKLGSLSIAVKNLAAHSIRTGFMMFFVFLMSATFFFSAILVDNMNAGITNTTERMGADIIVIPKEGTEELRGSLFAGKPCSVFFEKEWNERIEKLEGVKRVSPQLYIATLSASCCDAAVQLIAFDPKTDFVVKPWLSEQKELELEPGEVVAGYNLAAGVGDTVKFYNTEFKVAAKLEKSGMGYDNSVFMTFETIYKISDAEVVPETLQKEYMENIISMLMVDVEEDVTPGVFKIDIQNAYPDEEEIYACTADDLMSGLAEQVKKLTGYGSILAFFLIISTSLALICIFVITINERKYEFGILYTWGAKKSQVMQIILLEAFIISLTGGVAGVLIAYLCVFSFKSTLSVKLDIPFLNVGLSQILPITIICIGISLFMGLIAAFCSVYNIGKIEPYRLIRENE